MRYSYSIFILLLAGLLTFGGCRKRSVVYDLPSPELAQDTSLVDIAIILRHQPMERTKVMDEGAIVNLNLFFVHASYPSAANPEIRHYYFEEATPGAGLGNQLHLTNIRLGKYKMYAVANYNQGKMCSHTDCGSVNNDPSEVGSNLCNLTEDNLKAFELYPTGSDRLLMTCYDENVEIRKVEASQTPIDVSLIRQQARVNLTVNIDETNSELDDLKIIGLTYVNWADKIKSFSGLSTGSSIGMSPRTLSDASVTNGGKNASWVGFPLANRQGVKTTVNAPEKRNSQNAPTDAGYIIVNTEKDASDKYSFSVYLGDNQTDNFNLRENTSHTVVMNINGTESDPRISSISITQPTFSSGTGVRETSGEFEIKVSNCYNDTFLISPGANPPNEGKFAVFLWDAQTGAYGPALPAQGGKYNVLETDDGTTSPAAITLKCKLQYTLTGSFQPVALNAALITNSGSLTITPNQTVIFTSW